MDEGLSNLDRYGKGLYQDSPPAARRSLLCVLLCFCFCWCAAAVRWCVGVFR